MSTKVKTFFNKYANDPADKIPDTIGPNGIASLLEDLRLEPTDRRVLVLAHRLNAETQCEFTWTEWSEGLKGMRVDTIDSLRKQLDAMDFGVCEIAAFRPLYQFTFKYGKPIAVQRNLSLEYAIVYWKILFKDQWALLPLWEDYLTNVYKKDITKDTWGQLFDFAHTIKMDFSNYNEEESWPVVLDEFVKWARPRLNRA